MNQFGRGVENGVSTGGKSVARETVGLLGGRFGKDSGRAVIVSLEDGDVISFRPKGTRQEVTATVSDLYGMVLARKAQVSHLEKARAKKLERQAKREREQIRREDARIRRAARRALK